MEMIIFVGLPASGKSYYYHAQFASTHVHVSKDLLRNAKDKNKRQESIIEEALKKGQSVVVDNTNPRRQDRAPLIELARKYGATVTCYYFNSTVKDCVERNKTRQGKARVPAVAIYVAAKRMQPPELPEGFNEIITVTL
jgi:predicted kinase